MDYKIILLAHETIAGAVIELIRKSKVRLVSMEPATPGDYPAGVERAKVRHAKTTIPGRSVEATVVELLQDGKWHTAKALAEHVASKGYSENSAAPECSNMLAKGMVERRGKRRSFEYRLPSKSVSK